MEEKFEIKVCFFDFMGNQSIKKINLTTQNIERFLSINNFGGEIDHFYLDENKKFELFYNPSIKMIKTPSMVILENEKISKEIAGTFFIVQKNNKGTIVNFERKSLDEIYKYLYKVIMYIGTECTYFNSNTLKIEKILV